MDTGVLFLRELTGGGVNQTTDLHLVPSLKITGAMPLLPPCALVVLHRDFTIEPLLLWDVE